LIPGKEVTRKEKLKIYRDVFYASLFRKQNGDGERVEKIYETGFYNNLKQNKI